MNQFAEFNNYINSPVAIYKDELYNLPFNMNTFSKMWGIKTQKKPRRRSRSRERKRGLPSQRTWRSRLFLWQDGDVYEKLIKGYTEKHGGVPARNFRLLSSSACPSALSTTIIISTTAIRESPWAAIRRSWKRCWKAQR